MPADTTNDGLTDLRPVLENKTRDELNVLAKKLGVSGFSRLQKSQVIDLLLAGDRLTLNAILFPTWWHRHHNHVYGLASVVGVVLAVVFFVWPTLYKTSKTESRDSEPSPEFIHNSSNVAAEDVGEPFEINTNVERRDQILGVTVGWNDKSSGIVLLDRIDVKTLEQLFRERFIDPNDRKNESPTATQFLTFMQKHPGVLAHGFAVSPSRVDYGVIIDGLSVQPSYASKELKLAFFEFCKDADEVNLEDGLWAWWD